MASLAASTSMQAVSQRRASALVVLKPSALPNQQAIVDSERARIEGAARLTLAIGDRAFPVRRPWACPRPRRGLLFWPAPRPPAARSRSVAAGGCKPCAWANWLLVPVVWLGHDRPIARPRGHMRRGRSEMRAMAADWTFRGVNSAVWTSAAMGRGGTSRTQPGPDHDQPGAHGRPEDCS